MHTLSALAFAASSLLCSSQVFAEDLTIRLTDPNFKVVVPGAQQVQFRPHPSAPQNPAALLLGSTPDGFNVSALSEKADGASAQQCASWLVGSTVSRYKPDLATVQVIPAGANAWVLLYAFSIGPAEQLKAHVFSGNDKGRCLEIHMSRFAATPEQREAWFRGFRGITVSSELSSGAGS
jgi:hypothetical protein